MNLTDKSRFSYETHFIYSIDCTLPKRVYDY